MDREDELENVSLKTERAATEIGLDIDGVVDGKWLMRVWGKVGAYGASGDCHCSLCRCMEAKNGSRAKKEPEKILLKF